MRVLFGLPNAHAKPSRPSTCRPHRGTPAAATNARRGGSEVRLACRPWSSEMTAPRHGAASAWARS